MVLKISEACMTVSNTPAAPVRNMPNSVVSPQTAKAQAQKHGAAKALSPRATKFFLKAGAAPFWSGLAFSGVWMAGVLSIVAKAGPAGSFAGVPLVDWAIGVSAIVSPVALVWMVVAYLQRAADVTAIADPLRRQLAMITGESGAAEARIRRFNQGIREQIELLKNAQTMSKGDFASIMDRVLTHREDLEQFEQSSIQQVKDIQDIVRRNMQQIETLMDDKFTMLRILDDRLVQTGDTVARQTEIVRGNVSGLLDQVDDRVQQVTDALERSLRDGKKLADTSMAQEASLTAAAASAAETLNGLSGKIDMSVARFLERAGTAREEAERLAGALDAQTRSLDEFSNTLPVRVSEAESVMRGVADRLYASEQLAREQASQLSEKLSWQVDGLQAFLDRFSARLSDVDGNLQQRRNDLDALATRIDSAASNFTSAWEVSMNGLSDRANDTIVRFSALNDETRKGADQVANHLSETTAKYESSAIRLHRLSDESAQRMKEMTSEIGAQLSQFESLREASDKAGAEVQDRAAAAMQNLQHVLERLLTARESTTAIGETLVRDLHDAVEQNEHLIVRLNEAAQMSVRAIGIASESLGRQEGESAERTRAASAMLQEAALQMQQQAQVAERGLRDQAIGLMALLNETRSQMSATEQNMQGFAARALPPIQEVVRQIDVSADQGLQSIGKYGEGLNEQLSRLQQFHSRVGGMGEDMTRVTADTVAAIDQINARFASVRVVQEETARQTLEQFADLADRLQREVAGLDGQSSKAVETLQQAAARVGEQSYQLLQNAENSGAKMQIIASTLQNEASQIRAILQKQADDLGADLSRAEKQFSTLGDALKQRTDAAYALLDRVAVHYNETTRSATQDLESRTQQLEQVTGQAQAKAETLSATLTQQLSLIGNGASQLEANAAQVGTTSGKALQQLSALSEKITFTHEVANNNARQTITRLDECNAAFARQGNVLSDVVQTSVAQIQKAGATLGEQTTKLQDNHQRVDQNMRQLASTASSVHEQSTQIRNAMEQQNQRLMTQLTESVAQLAATGGKLEQTTATALLGADQASARFNDVAQTASNRLSTSYQEMEAIANKAEAMLSTFGIGVTQQSASLSVISEQLSEQYRAMTSANESQRTQLVELFDKLGSAHAQASDVAERTITRLSESLNQIQHQLGLLSDQSQTAVGNVRTASSGFADQTALLIQSAQGAEQQARTVLSVTATLQEQARQMQEQIQNDSQRSGDALSSLVNKLTSGGSELRDFSSNTEMSLTSLNNTVMQQSRDLSGAMVQLGDRQRSLTTALDAQRDVLNGLLHRFALAQDETAATAERTASRLAEGSTQIELHIETIGSQAQSTLSNVQAVNAGFTDQTRLLVQNAQQAEQQVRSILSVTTNLQEQARQLQEQMLGDSKRASDTLGGLIVKLTSGSADLREVSSTTESSLTSLNTTITQHAEGLNGTMTHIGERQRVLASALDGQREVLNSLLHRLALAQDETAATAERTASRLTEGSTQIARQMETIGSQAQSTLASVQAANAGFADEAGALNLHAQQAEQQMRGILTVTAGLQDQTRQMRETMQTESARVIEQLSAAIAQLDNTTQMLKTQGNSAVHVMDQTVLQFATHARSSSDEMLKQVDVLTEATDRAETRLSAVGENVRNHLKLVNDMGEQTESQSRQLADSAEYATNRLVALRETLADADSESQKLVAQATARIADARSNLQGELMGLAELSHETVKNIAAASSSLIGQNDTLRSNLAMSESALQEAADLIRQENAQLPALLDRSAQKIEASAKELKNQAGESDAVLVGTADRFISVTAAARETMTDEMRRISVTAEQANGLLGDFAKALALQMEAFKSGTDILSREQVGFVTRAGESVSQLAAASDRLASLRNDAAQTAERMAEEFEALDQRASSTSQRLSETSGTVVKTIDALSQATQRAESQMTGASGQFREQLERIRAGLQGQVDDINRGLMQITAQLERTGTTLRSTTVGTVADVERIAQRFDQTSKEASAQLSDKTARMRASTEEVAKLLSGFGDQLDVLLDRLATAGDGIRRHEGDLVGQLQTALTHLSAVTEKLETGRTLAADVSEQTVSKLGAVVDTIQTEMQNLTAGSQTAAGIMRGIGHIYGEQTQALNQGVREAHGQVQVMNKSIDDMQQRTDRMRVSLKLQSDELMMSLQQILSQLSETGDTLSDTVDHTLKGKIEDGLKKIS
jgi:hypothetical protein